MRLAGRVLVVDDDPTFLATVQDLLMAERYVVDGATTVGAALDLLWQDWEQQPDAILLALHLSTVDGQPFADLYDVLPVRHAPVLLITGEATLGEHTPGEIPAGDLQKPVTREALLACLARATNVAMQEPVSQP
jgi:CheY-like chemotaxis protein